MKSNKRIITISIPESMIPGLRELSVPVLLYLDHLHVEDGFALRKDEYVTSLKAEEEVRRMTGLPSAKVVIMDGQG
ncbi:hypothetical protein [Yokenella regensburgei]|uniref:hypothetical protein n=1 Tax=Yokenella regensburgei TaxID=158877 RepID=UPI0013763BEE|nr:hypothetical protein [Yokenella regensburgei]